MSWKDNIRKAKYRQCGDCGSLDFTHSVENVEERPSTIKFSCLKCKNQWEEKIQ